MAKSFAISINLTAIDNATKVLSGVTGKFRAFSESVSKMNAKVNGHGKEGSGGLFAPLLGANLASNALSVAFDGIKQFLVDSVQADKTLDALSTGLTVTMGSASKATAEISKLKVVAKLPGLGMEEAIQGSLRLQAAGLTAEKARKALYGFGNALATAGKGKDDLNGVTDALTKMISTGKISERQIEEISLRVPMIRQLEKSVFGTSEGSELKKIGVDKYVDGITKALLKLPPVADTLLNDFDNFNASLFDFQSKVGKGLEPAVRSVLTSLSDIMDNTGEAVGKKISGLINNIIMPAIQDFKVVVWQIVRGINLWSLNNKDVIADLKSIGPGLANIFRQLTPKALTLLFDTALGVLSIVTAIDHFVKRNKGLTEAIVMIAAGALAVKVLLGPISQVIELFEALSDAIEFVGGVFTSFQAIEAGLMTWPELLALIISPAGLVAGAIFVVSVAAIAVWRNWDKIKSTVKGFFDWFSGGAPLAKWLRAHNIMYGCLAKWKKGWDDFKVSVLKVFDEIGKSPVIKVLAKLAENIGQSIGTFVGNTVKSDAEDIKWLFTDPAKDKSVNDIHPFGAPSANERNHVLGHIVIHNASTGKVTKMPVGATHHHYARPNTGATQHTF